MVSNWCNISGTLISHTLDSSPSVNSFGPRLYCQLLRLLNLNFFWSWTLSNLPPLRMGLHQGLGPRSSGSRTNLNEPYFGTQILDPNSKIGFSNHEKYFLELALSRFRNKTAAKLATLHFFIPWTLCKPLWSKTLLATNTLGLLKVGVSQVLDPE